MTPLVSIIIPAYNQARFVTQTIDSALAQTYPNIEVIAVNDGSTDDTAAILAGYGSRIKTFSQPNQGLAAARNTGLAAARGEYLLFLDADDLIPPPKIAQHLARFEDQPDAGIVYSGWQYIDRDGNPLPGEMRPRRQGLLLRPLLLSEFYCIPGAAVIKRSVLEQVGQFDESLRAEEDTDWWIRAASAGCQFGYVDELLLQYRLHPASLSTQAEHQVKYAFARLNKFFAANSLPAEIQQLKPQAYSAAHFVAAGRYYRAGKIEPGGRHLAQALAVYPAIAANEPHLRQKISGIALIANANNPLATMHALLSDPELPAVIRSIEPQIRGLVYLDVAASHYFAGQRELAIDLLRRVPVVLNNAEWLLDWVASTALTAPLTPGCPFIDWIFDNLPEYPPGLRRRAYGRYHAAAAFLAYQNGHSKEVRRHILPAVWDNPAIVINRGFIRIGLRSLFA